MTEDGINYVGPCASAGAPGNCYIDRKVDVVAGACKAQVVDVAEKGVIVSHADFVLWRVTPSAFGFMFTHDGIAIDWNAGMDGSPQRYFHQPSRLEMAKRYPCRNRRTSVQQHDYSINVTDRVTESMDCTPLRPWIKNQ